MSRVDLALLGFGSVGQALAQRLDSARPGPRIVAACDSTGALVDPSGIEPGPLLDAKDETGRIAGLDGEKTLDLAPADVAAKADADVVVQLTPTHLNRPEASLKAIEAALAEDKDVVTAAKDALACRPRRVQAAVDASQGRLRASAAVGGSVPVLETLGGAFRGDEIEAAQALLNGSSTFVLSRMEQGSSREQALAEARSRGLLEADPSADLSGRDAAAKATILHQQLYGSACSLDGVTVDGIGSVDEQDCREATARGFAIRLLARIGPDGVQVGPVELPSESPLVVQGPKCAVRLQLAGAGAIELAGPGAGPKETASSVLSDVLALSREDRSRQATGKAATRARAAGG